MNTVPRVDTRPIECYQKSAELGDGTGWLNFARLCEGDLSNAAHMNITLTELRLSDQTDQSAQSLAAMLKNNKTVHTLVLCDSQIGYAGMSCLSEAFKNNPILTTFDFRGNQLSENTKQLLRYTVANYSLFLNHFLMDDATFHAELSRLKSKNDQGLKQPIQYRQFLQ